MPNASFFNDRTDAVVFPERVTGSLWTAPRVVGGKKQAYNSGVLALTYFTAPAADTITNVKLYTTAAQGAGATINRVGLFTEASTGALTRVAVTANDATLFDTVGEVSKDFSASVDLIPGQRYALGVLTVSSGATADFLCDGGLEADQPGLLLFAEPRLAAMVTSQTDMPSTVANASIAAQDNSNTTTPGRLIAKLT